jgi:energy-coupling factor transporter transmembrane protein EcfT
MPAVDNGRSLAGVVAELKDELKEFLQTRFEMLRSEWRHTLRAWKLALPMMACGAALIATAWFILTAALVAIVAAAFYPSRFAYFFAFAIVGVVYLLAGGICAAFAIRAIRDRGIVPQRTIKVLKDDATWFQTEARG